MHRRIESIGKKPPLFSAIFKHVLHPQIQYYPVYVGTRRAITRLARKEKPVMKKSEATASAYSQLLPLDNLTKLPKDMASGLERYFNVNEMHDPKKMAPVGSIGITIVREGNKTIAIPMHYYPKEKVCREYFRGIRAAAYESKIFEHLKRTEGVTHVDQVYGSKDRARGLLEGTTRYRRKQLKAYGIDPLKIYTVDEWISRLRSEPDYARIKK